MTGARWFRAALQVNPFAYVGNPTPSQKYPDEASYNAALINKLQELSIELIAVTDHWNASTAAQLISDAEAAGIVALPGFEANTSEGIHLLVIFERQTNIDSVTAAIGACGLTPGSGAGTTTEPYNKILSAMTTRGALVIPAHANVANSGLLSRARGATLAEMVKNPELLAIGISPGSSPLGDQLLILNGTSPYARSHPLVAIHADDISDPAALSSAGGSTWFKMSRPSLLGLRHAVKTPETRVSVADPTSKSRVLLRSISWEGGYLDGQTVNLAEDLTALIGGRGTGKSTVIESLRYVLDIEPIGQAAKIDHAGVVQSVLGAGCEISLTIDVVSPAAARYTIQRMTNSVPVVRDATGTPTSQRPRDVVGSLEIFGQHELAELAQDKDLMAELVSRAAGLNTAPGDRAAAQKALADNRDELARTERDKAELEAELADIPRLTESVEAFKATDLAVKLALKTRLNLDESIFSDVAERTQAVSEKIAEIGLAELVDDLRLPLSQVDSSPQKIVLERLSPELEKIATTIETLVTSVNASILSAKSSIDAIKQVWDSNTQADRDGVAAVLRQLVDEGHKPNEYLTLQENLNRLTKRAERGKVFEATHSRLLRERTDLLQQLAEIERTASKELRDAIRISNASTLGTVFVKTVSSPDRGHIKAVVNGHFKGQRTQIHAAIDMSGFSVDQFLAAARGGADSLVPFGIAGAQCERLLSAGEPLFRELEEKTVGLAVEVRLNVAQPGQSATWRRLEDLSKGQRATALLLLLLGAPDSPLIIDQPEDDLDNRFVYDGVVQKLRSLKGLRQLVVSTHNANVPVLGDAELLVTLEADGQHGHTVEDGVGSLDDPVVRKYAEDILEGGKAAFDARRRLYDF